MTRPAPITVRVAAMALLLTAAARTPPPPPRWSRPRARRMDVEAYLGWQPADPEAAWERRHFLA